MTRNNRETKGKPGVSQSARLSDEGLRRLEVQLQRGARISQAVLGQWEKRYGEAAQALIEKYSKVRS
ncbi:MAG: hypothetical protein OQL16_06605 [Gammaproteobacteria bacterium]|nr:hypothetical protein [Gammaproteobacteria bacterium]